MQIHAFQAAYPPRHLIYMLPFIRCMSQNTTPCINESYRIRYPTILSRSVPSPTRVVEGMIGKYLPTYLHKYVCIYLRYCIYKPCLRYTGSNVAFRGQTISALRKTRYSAFLVLSGERYVGTSRSLVLDHVKIAPFATVERCKPMVRVFDQRWTDVCIYSE